MSLKNKTLSIFVVSIMTIVAIFSCRQEISGFLSPGIENDKDIQDAKTWYDNNVPKGVSLGAFRTKASASKSRLNARPDWQHAYKVKHSDCLVVQTPLSVLGGLRIITPDHQQAFDETGDERYVETLTQMVVVTDKQTGYTEGFLMTLIPDVDYLKTTSFKAFYSSYEDWQKNYSGLVFYHSLEGKFVNGWRFANGNVVNSITPKEDAGVNIALKSNNKGSRSVTNCIDYYYQTWSMICTEYHTTTESGGAILSDTSTGTSCSNWYADGYQYAYTQCSYSSGGSGGYKGDASPIAKSINLDDRGRAIFNATLLKMQQLCAYSTMYNWLVGSGYKFNDVYINSANTAAGGYIPQTQDLTFRDNNLIEGSLPEEFIHMFQDHCYTGGLANYTYLGHSNIEFEAKLIQDILCVLTTGGCSLLGSSSQMQDVNYFQWLKQCTNNFATFPSYSSLLIRHSECFNMNYWDFLNAFATSPEHLDYHYPVSIFLQPQVINFINGKCYSY